MTTLVLWTGVCFLMRSRTCLRFARVAAPLRAEAERFFARAAAVRSSSAFVGFFRGLAFGRRIGTGFLRGLERSLVRGRGSETVFLRGRGIGTGFLRSLVRVRVTETGFLRSLPDAVFGVLGILRDLTSVGFFFAFRPSRLPFPRRVSTLRPTVTFSPNLVATTKFQPRADSVCLGALFFGLPRRGVRVDYRAERGGGQGEGRR